MLKLTLCFHDFVIVIVSKKLSDSGYNFSKTYFGITHAIISLMRDCVLFTVICIWIIAGSRRARNLFCTPHLDFGAKLLCQNRSINPRKPTETILKDGRRVAQCTRFSKPKFRVIGLLTYIFKCTLTLQRLTMERYSLLKLNSRYDVKRRAASDENLFRRTSFAIRCEPTVEPKKITSTMFFSREYSTNMANNDNKPWDCMRRRL